MKIEIYEPSYAGYVSLNPYDWEYEGRYPSVTELLESEPDYKVGVATEFGEGIAEPTDRQYLERLTSDLKQLNIWGVKYVDD